MNVAGFLRWTLKKPMIIAIVVVCAIAGGVQGWMSTTSHFETSASVLVIPPGAGSKVPGDNPFVNLDTGTAQVAYVLSTIAQSEPGRATVAKAGASPDFVMSSTAGSDSFAQLSPQVTFTVSGPDADSALAGVRALIAFLQEQLLSIQKDAGVVDGTFADLRVPVSPTAPVEVGGDGFRAAVGLAMGAGLAALLLALIAAAAFEALQQRRQHAAVAGDSAKASPGGPGLPPLTAPKPDGEPSPDAAADNDSAKSREPGAAARRAMTRWRDRVEEIPEESEFPLPDLSDTDDPGLSASNALSSR